MRSVRMDRFPKTGWMSMTGLCQGRVCREDQTAGGSRHFTGIGMSSCLRRPSGAVRRAADGRCHDAGEICSLCLCPFSSYGLHLKRKENLSGTGAGYWHDLSSGNRTFFIENRTEWLSVADNSG